jgi:CheY-like chemotaxis protein
MNQSDFYPEPSGSAEEPQSSGGQSHSQPGGSGQEQGVPAKGPNGSEASSGNRSQQRFGRHGGGGGGRRRRGRGRRRGPNGQGHDQRGHRHQRGGGGGQHRGFTGPMDHSYRNQNGADNMGNTSQPSGQRRGGGRQRFRRGGRGGFQQNFSQQMGNRGFSQSAADLEPLAISADAPTRIFAFVDDLFFMTKIQEISRKLNVKVEFVKNEKDVLDKAGEEDKPSLIIVDLNNINNKPLTIIPKLKSKFKKGTTILGFVSHVQGELKQKAQEAGCDVVMPRSAFSQNLPQLLRRHGAPDELEQ